MLFADILMRRDIATVPLGIGRIHRIEKLEDEIPGKEDRLREILNYVICVMTPRDARQSRALSIQVKQRAGSSASRACVMTSAHNIAEATITGLQNTAGREGVLTP